MEFDELKFKPSSNREVLYQQVEKQSDICDVTIQVGTWKKKFHWCVLVMSPFFECTRRSDFIERQTGLVKFDVGTPATMEIAILFLYGKRPKLTEPNVEAVLELAEFLLIPNLKSACTAFLKSVPITGENCMKMLQISSLYDFEFSQCCDYIRANLPEILREEEATFLTKESVMTLLSDPLLSYVSDDDKFEFAIRWADATRHNRNNFHDIMEVIDQESVSANSIDTGVLQNPLVAEISGVIPNMQTRDALHYHRVVMFPLSTWGNRKMCFDLEIERWCGVETGSSLTYQVAKSSIIGTQGPSVIYRVLDRYINGNRTYEIISQDLHSKKYTTSTVIPPENMSCTDTFSDYYIHKDTSIVVLAKSTEIYQNRPTRSEDTVQPEILERGDTQIDPAHQVGDAEEQFGESDDEDSRRYMYIKTATIFVGKISHPETHVRPLLSLRKRKEEGHLMCLNDNNQIALYSESESNSTLLIYDLTTCQLDAIPLDCFPDQDYNYSSSQLAAKDNGFVLYNADTIVNISSLTGPVMTERYEVRTIDLKKHLSYCNSNKSSILYSNETLFRLFKKSSSDSEVEFARVSHDKLMHANESEVAWEQLPSPPHDIDLVEKEGNAAFMMELPASLLRCHYDCPHCTPPQQQYTGTIRRRQVVSTRRTYLVTRSDGSPFYYSESDDDSCEDGYDDCDDYVLDYFD